MEPEIEIQLDRSEYIKQRLHSMKSLQIPTITETRKNLGLPLAEIVFDQCDSELKLDYGLTPLKGTGDELWVSPSDLLIGKVALTPPLTCKHIQALTHEGILEIGYDIEKKFLTEMRIHEENYYEVTKKHILEQLEELFRIEARNIELRERQACQNQQDKMIEEFNCIILEELNSLEEKLRQEQEEELNNRKELLDVEWENKFSDAINETVQKMTLQFLKELERQNDVLTTHFKLEIQKAHLQKSYEINLERTKCQESFKQLKYNLECKNVANMMYVLCMERRKCCEGKNSIELYYLREMQKLAQIISDKDQRIQKLTKEKDKQIREVQLRETCLLEILKQFQKFINFALRAAPTQAEFLLSIEKMMAFELASAVLKSNYSHLKHCNEILPWQDQDKPLTVPIEGLEIEDHHNCFKELSPRENEDEERVGNLPAFHFQDKLYIREDFRNMISQGIEITGSNEMWSKDVEILIQTLKKSVSHLVLVPEQGRPSEVDSMPFSEEFEENDAHKSIGIASVQFVDSLRILDKQKTISVDETKSQGKKLSNERRASLKPVLNSLNTINFEQIGTTEKKPTLLATTNSLELIMKRGSVRRIDTESYSEEFSEVPFEKCDVPSQESETSLKVIKKGSYEFFDEKERGSIHSNKKTSPKQSENDALVLETKDSIILRKTSLVRRSAEFTVIPKDSIELHRESKTEIKRKPSKLVTAKNSLELMRESKIKISDLPNAYQRDLPKQKSITSNQVSVCPKSKCVDKCSQTKDVLNQLCDMTEEGKQSRKGSMERSIKLSHIEVITVEDNGKEKDVGINEIPIVYDSGSATYRTDLTGVYKEPRKKTKVIKKKKEQLKKDKFLNLPSTVKVVGDQKATEHIETVDEFTENRIHSLIELIKDNPTLMRTFTACTR